MQDSRKVFLNFYLLQKETVKQATSLSLFSIYILTDQTKNLHLILFFIALYFKYGRFP